MLLKETPKRENVSLSDTKRTLLFLPLRSLGLISNAYCLRYFHGSYISEPDDDRIVSHDALRFMLYYHCVRDISSLLRRGSHAEDDGKRETAGASLLSFPFPSCPARSLFFFSPASPQHKEASAEERVTYNNQ